MNDLICKVAPEGLDLAFGLVRLIPPLAGLSTLCAAIDVWPLVVVGVYVGLGLHELDVEGGFCGWVCSPVVGDDGDLVLDVWGSGWAGGRGTGVEEVLIGVRLG